MSYFNKENFRVFLPVHGSLAFSLGSAGAPGVIF